MRHRLLGTAAVALFLLSGGCGVSKETYLMKENEAVTCANDLGVLKRKHQELVLGNDLLEKRVTNQRLELANTISERDRIKTDLAYVTGARDKAVADNKELEALLHAKSDILSQTIGELRTKLADLEDANRRVRQESASLEKALEGKTLQGAELQGAHEKLKQDLAARQKENEETTRRLGEAQRAQDEKARRVAELQDANEKLRREFADRQKTQEEKVEKVSSTYESLLEKMKGEISKGEVTISELKGKLTVNMVDSILFDSGKAEVKPAGLSVLQKVVSILKDVKDKSIRIEGHTDKVQIVGALARQYPTNWELSSARAINVTRYLQKQGIGGEILSAVAYAENRPIAENDTPEGKAKNRRIEINLVPKE